MNSLRLDVAPNFVLEETWVFLYVGLYIHIFYVDICI